MKSLKYSILIPILLFIFACSSVSKPLTTEYDTQMLESFDNYYTQYQFDSICTVDDLDNDLEQWYMIPLRDYETKENISQYLYIKSLGKYESIYRLQIINDSTYKITKRITQ